MTPAQAQLWQRLADLRPQLRPDISIHYHDYRGENACVLADDSNGESYQLSGSIAEVINGFDGTASIHALQQAHRDSASRADCVELLLALHQHGLLQTAAPAGATDTPKPSWLAALKNPLFLRLPLFSLDAGARAVAPFCQWFYRSYSKFILLLCAFIGVLQSISYSSALGDYAARHIGSAADMLLIALIYIVVKCIHELAHAAFCRYHGCRVGNTGLAFLLFFPVPYVDVSQSATLSAKHQRMSIAAAGIGTELLLAFGALQVWLFCEYPLLRELAFYTLLTAGLSSILFNANPLLRFDGYYVLSDYLEIPNLATRASAYLKSSLRWLLLGRRADEARHPDEGIRYHLLCFGLLSRSYRIGLSISIAAYLGSKWFSVGAALGVWVVVTQLLMPGVRFAEELRQQAVQQGKGARLATQLLVICLFVAAILLIDMPHSAVLRGVAHMPLENTIKAETAGFIERIHADNNAAVSKGQALFTLRNLELRQTLQERRAELAIAEAERRMASKQTASMLMPAMEKVRRLQEELQVLQKQVDALTVRSPASGRLSLVRQATTAGSFIHQGLTLAHVETDLPLQISLAADQQSYWEIQDCLQDISIRRRHNPSEIFSARIHSFSKEASHHLPYARLGDSKGGDISVDKTDPHGTKSLQPVFIITLTSKTDDISRWSGQAVNAKFRLCDKSTAEKIMPKLWKYFNEHH